MSLFIAGFIKSTVFVSVFIVFLIAIKGIFKNKINFNWNFKMWYVLLFLMAVPLFPADFIHLPFINGFGSVSTVNEFYITQGTVSGATEAENALVKDIYISVNKIFTEDFYNILGIIYLTGVVVLVFITVKNYIKIRNILKFSFEPDKNIKEIFNKSLYDLGIKNKRIKLVISDSVKSPFLTGLINPVVVFPFSYGCLEYDEIRYIMLHEIGHFKNRDILNCFVLCFYQIIYWFNPIVYFGLKEMKSEMEIRCDRLVVEKIGIEKAKNYGLTIIKSAQKGVFEPRIRTYAAFGANNSLLKRRIESIACISYEKSKNKLKSIAVFLLVFAIGICQMPFACNAYGFNDYFKTGNEKIVAEDLSAFFKDSPGCFVLYTPKEDIFYVYNDDYAKKRISPNSTYKIYSAVIALEEGIITPDNSFMKWDGKDNPFDSWNMDQDIKSAMENSVNWYFNSLNEKIGADKTKEYLKLINYGNEDISGNSDFYLESSLKISAIEQTKVLSNLFNGVYGFDKENINAVKDAITVDKNNEAVLYGKTGTGNINGKNVNGSFVGCVEKGEKEYFFAVNLYSSDGATGAKAYNKALEILNYMGIY